MLIVFCASFFVFGAGVGRASAATYYVDSAIVDANVSSAVPDCTNYDPVAYVCGGGNGNAYKTIADVNLKTFSGGDNIYFRRGQTWIEQLAIAQSGTAGNPIKFGAYGAGNKPIIDAQNTRSYAITFGGLNYITIENIQVQNAISRNIWSDSVGGNIILNYVDSVGGATGIWIRQKSNSTYTNITAINATAGIGFNLTNSATNVAVTNVTATGNAGAGIDLETITNLTVSGLTAKSNTGDGIIFRGLVGILTADNLLAGGGAGLGNAGPWGGITIKGSTNLTYTLTNSTSSYNTNNGLKLEDLRNGSILGTVDNVIAEYNNGTGINIGYVINTTVKNSVSRYNQSFGNGIAISDENSNITFINCIVHDNAWDGISFHGIATNIIVDKCNSYNNGTIGQINSGDGFTSHDTVTGVQIINSIAHDNRNSGLAIVGLTSGVAYNNVFYNNGSTGFTRGGYWSQVAGGSGWILKNNIFSQNYPHEFHVDVNGLVYTTADNNLYYHSANNKIATIDDGIIDLSWALYHTTNSYEQHSIYGDPLFVNPTSNFSLQNISPAINAGTEVGLTTDYAGNPKSGANWDIGAYEFQDSTAPTTTANISTGLYNSTQTITLTCDDGAGVGCDKIYYTTNGDVPTTGSTQYTTPLSIATTTTIKFFAQDRNQNSETPQTKIYTIDTTFPETSINSNPNAIINTTSATFTFSADETATFQCKLDSGAYASCTSPKNYINLAEGVHAFSVKATDTATNEDATPASYTFTVDTQIPTISDIQPNNTTFPVTTTSTNLTLATSETTICKYATTSGVNYTDMTIFDSTNNTTHSTAIANLNPGTTYDYYIICKDQINESTESHLTFSIAPIENTNISLENIKIKINQEVNKFKDKIYSWKNKFKLKNQDNALANGQVQIYRNNKKIETINVDEHGFWQKMLKLRDNFSGTIKIKQYDQYGTLVSSQKEKIEVDTEKPVFTNFPMLLQPVTRGTKINFQATDNQEIKKYKVTLAGYTRITRNASYQIPQNIPTGVQLLTIKATDAAGNATTQETYVWVR